MKRHRRFIIRRILLGLTVAVIAAPVAQAKPTPAPQPDQVVVDQPTLRIGPGEIPYYDDMQVTLGPGEIPSVDDGTPAPTRHTTSIAAVDNGGTDLRYGIVSSAVIFLLLAVVGMVLAIRHGRKTRLLPA